MTVYGYAATASNQRLDMCATLVLAFRRSYIIHASRDQHRDTKTMCSHRVHVEDAELT